jgi:DNA-binding HxlR family transcriptional regulator
MSFLLTKVPYQQQPMRYEYRLTPKGLDLYPPIVTLIVYWGDVHLSGKKGRPLVHTHDLCGLLTGAVLKHARVVPGPPP